MSDKRAATAVIDYGVGNLFSLTRALAYLGADTVISDDPAVIAAAPRVILPGVGAFGDAIDKLRARPGLVDALDAHVRAQKPLLGICVGMQLLFEKGYEFGTHEGLGYLPGDIHDLAPDIPYKTPHMGWNSLRLIKPSDAALDGIHDGEYVYYVHSFYAKCPGEIVLAGSDYGVFIPSVVRRGSVYGTQFHPEKSGDTGQKILRAFLAGN